jgi:YebC/PmpR family DNA-binding regulatory protein
LQACGVPDLTGGNDFEEHSMGRQWLHAKRAVASLKKSRATGKLVKEIMVAAKLGGPDLSYNARLSAAVEKARKDSVAREVIERAIKKGAGTGGEKMAMEHLFFEGYVPHKIPVIVEVYTDNHVRTAHEIRSLFRKGHLGTSGSNKFLFDHLGLVEAYHPSAGRDIEADAIEAGANDVEAITHQQNDDIPEGANGARFQTDPTSTSAVSKWLSENGWHVVMSELGYLARQFPPLSEEEAAEVADFLQALEDHQDVHRVWAALR